jgi:hypothetical protein
MIIEKGRKICLFELYTLKGRVYRYFLENNLEDAPVILPYSSTIAIGNSILSAYFNEY